MGIRRITNSIFSWIKQLLGTVRSPIIIGRHSHGVTIKVKHPYTISLDIQTPELKEKLSKILSDDFVLYSKLDSARLITSKNTMSSDLHMKVTERHKSEHINVYSVRSTDMCVYKHKQRDVLFYKVDSSFYFEYEIKESNYIDSLVDYLYSDVESFIPKINKTRTNIMILVQDMTGIYFREINLQARNPKYIKSDYKYNYSTEVLEEYKKIRDNVLNFESGLYLLYGPPGCGKSALIYRLIDEVKSKEADYKFLYVTPEMTSKIGSPEFTDLLISIRESVTGPVVLVLEDTGEYIAARENRLPATVAILNITDGILNIAAGAGLSIIITYNNEDQEIDPAITRPGRCLGQIHIGSLSSSESDEWCNYHDIPSLGESLTLADLYHYKKSVLTGGKSGRELEGSLE